MPQLMKNKERLDCEKGNLNEELFKNKTTKKTEHY